MFKFYIRCKPIGQILSPWVGVPRHPPGHRSEGVHPLMEEILTATTKHNVDAVFIDGV